MENNKLNKMLKNQYIENKERAIKRIITNLNYGLNSIIEKIELTNEELEFIKSLKNDDVAILEQWAREIIKDQNNQE